MVVSTRLRRFNIHSLMMPDDREFNRRISLRLITLLMSVPNNVYSKIVRESDQTTDALKIGCLNRHFKLYLSPRNVYSQRENVPLCAMRVHGLESGCREKVFERQERLFRRSKPRLRVELWPLLRLDMNNA